MDDGLKLLQELKDGSYQAALFGSYNVSFPFFEEVVLRALRSRGCDHNLLLMDAAQCAANLSDPELAPCGAGRLYGVVPIVAPGAFHPKFVLLLGKRQSKLFLGSHNLTLSGFGLNREISNSLTITERASEALAQSVFQFALAWARTAAEEMAELVDSAKNWAPWLGAKQRQSQRETVLATMPTGPSLWDQLRERLENDPIRITIVGPYFDERLEFLSVLRKEFPDATITVGVSPQCSELDAVVAVRTSDITFKNLDGWYNDPAARVIHAKVLLIEYQNGESVVVSGSANPSAPAWLDVRHRNAELVLARRLEKGDPLPMSLGIKDLANQPNMTEAGWSQIHERRQRNGNSPPQKASAWLAFEQEDGFLVDAAFANQGDEVAVIDRNGDAMATVNTAAVANGRRFVPVDDARFRSGAVQLRAEQGKASHLALVQHIEELRDRATSEKRRSLRKALFDLDANDEGIDSYIAIIEKAIFDEEPVTREVGSARNTTSSTQASTGTVGVGALEKKGRRRPRFSAGDIGLVLDALIHRLGEGLPSGISWAGRTSEEEIDDETEVLHAVPTVDSGRVLAQRCRQKTRKLMQRMEKRLELAREGKAEHFGVVVQLVATLGLLARLRQRQRQLEWLPREEALIEISRHWSLLKRGAIVLFAPSSGVATGLVASLGDFSELASAAALILWSAWVSGLDLDTALIPRNVFARDENDEDDKDNEQAENLLGLGLILNCLNEDLLPAQPELDQLFGEDGIEWLTRHLTWAEEVMTAPAKAMPIRPGSVVQVHRRGKMDIGVVVAVGEGKVDVSDRITGQQRTFALDRVRWVGAISTGLRPERLS